LYRHGWTCGAGWLPAAGAALMVLRWRAETRECCRVTGWSLMRSGRFGVGAKGYNRRSLGPPGTVSGTKRRVQSIFALLSKERLRESAVEQPSGLSPWCDRLGTEGLEMRSDSSGKREAGHFEMQGVRQIGKGPASTVKRETTWNSRNNTERLSGTSAKAIQEGEKKSMKMAPSSHFCF
jgi:hypothetical protein